jgi:hypothetical protein
MGDSPLDRKQNTTRGENEMSNGLGKWVVKRLMEKEGYADTEIAEILED